MPKTMSTVMIVDDSHFIRLRLTKLLSQHGYQVVEAKDGEEAVQAYRRQPADAVLMDMAMPRKHGSAALREMRAFDPQARVIMLTGVNQQAVVLRAMQAGAEDFLVKPFDDEQVLKALQKALAKVA